MRISPYPTPGQPWPGLVELARQDLVSLSGLSHMPSVEFTLECSLFLVFSHLLLGLLLVLGLELRTLNSVSKQAFYRLSHNPFCFRLFFR
jgi:hypothetical protein